jgi:hypothetical protein
MLLHLTVSHALESSLPHLLHSLLGASKRGERVRIGELVYVARFVGTAILDGFTNSLMKVSRH